MDSERVVATEQPGSTLGKWQLFRFGVPVVYFGARSVSHGDRMSVLGFVITVLVLASYVALAALTRRTELVLTGDALEVRRRLRPITIHRRDVLAVQGDVAGRPTWSSAVRVETPGGVVKLPGLSRTPAELIPELQEWAGVGEHSSPAR